MLCLVQYPSVQCSTVQYIDTVMNSTLEWMLLGKVKYSSVQYTEQYSTVVQYSRREDCTRMQYNFGKCLGLT